ncbi:putative reverse transcriptase domain-containing protein [Tanacetum coccineum]
MSTAYHPQIDGQSERTIQTLEDMLRACVLDFGGSWDVHLPFGLRFCITIVYHSRLPRILRLYCRRQLVIARKVMAIRGGKPLEFSDRKEVITLGFVGPFEIIEKVGTVAYQLEFPKELNGVHDTFHVANLKKCLADLTLKMPLDEIRIDAKLNFVEELGIYWKGGV